MPGICAYRAFWPTAKACAFDAEAPARIAARQAAAGPRALATTRLITSKSALPEPNRVDHEQTQANEKGPDSRDFSVESDPLRTSANRYGQVDGGGGGN
jgi:hypothetical protein